MRPAAERRPGAVVEVRRPEGGRERARGGEVPVVALGLAGQRDVQRVVDVIAPLGGEPVPVGLARRDQPRVVQIRFGDQAERPLQPGGQRVDLGGQFLQQRQRPVVLDRVHRVEPQPVHVKVPQPAHGVVDHVPADLIGAGAVHVERGPPLVRAGEVRAEAVQVRTGRADVVVDDVQHHAEAAVVAGVHEPLEPVRAAVGLVHRPPQHPVVPPAGGAVECVDRHHLDQVDAEVGQVVEPLDGRVERPAGRERADVQLVQHGPGQRAAPSRRRRSSGTRSDRSCATARTPPPAATASADPPAGCRHRRAGRRSRCPAGAARAGATSRGRPGSSRRSGRLRASGPGSGSGAHTGPARHGPEVTGHLAREERRGNG